MGKIFNAVSSILGGGSAPKVSTAAIDATKEGQTDAKAARAALFGTEGGIAGSDLNPDQIGKRQTLLGN